MATKYRQISLIDTFSDCQDMFIEDTPSFFQLLDEHFDMNEFIPSVFTNAFYQHLGRKRIYPLTGFLSALMPSQASSCPDAKQMYINDEKWTVDLRMRTALQHSQERQNHLYL